MNHEHDLRFVETTDTGLERRACRDPNCQHTFARQTTAGEDRNPYQVPEADSEEG